MPLKHLNDITLSRSPFCAVCNKPVDSISFHNESLFRWVRFRVFCHGKEEDFCITYDGLEYETLDLPRRKVFLPKLNREKIVAKQLEFVSNEIDTLRRVRV